MPGAKFSKAALLMAKPSAAKSQASLAPSPPPPPPPQVHQHCMPLATAQGNLARLSRPPPRAPWVPRRAPLSGKQEPKAVKTAGVRPKKPLPMPRASPPPIAPTPLGRPPVHETLRLVPKDRSRFSEIAVLKTTHQEKLDMLSAATEEASDSSLEQGAATSSSSEPAASSQPTPQTTPQPLSAHLRRRKTPAMRPRRRRRRDP